MKTNLEDLKKFKKDELIMRVEKLENCNARLISEVQELLIETTQKRNLINDIKIKQKNTRF